MFTDKQTNKSFSQKAYQLNKRDKQKISYQTIKFYFLTKNYIEQVNAFNE